MAVAKVTLNNTVIVDMTDATATAAEILQDETAYIADGSKAIGTASGGGITITDEQNATGTTAVVVSGGSGGGATQHSIYFEFFDGTDTTIPVYYDDNYLTTMITAYHPVTYGSKTVSLAQLDGVTWYNPANIPIGVQLIDFTQITSNYIINNDMEEEYLPGGCVSDYTLIDPTMTFEWKGYQWFVMCLYDSSKNPILVYDLDVIKDSAANEISTGTLTPAMIPSNAMYVRIDGYPSNPDATRLSLIRTA
ncbi:MAG: hypothetical protein J6U54_05425 [Clostridiales bacterium]|nr:hypothetical protein [Clostridiales bacterium]